MGRASGKSKRDLPRIFARSAPGAVSERRPVSFDPALATKHARLMNEAGTIGHRAYVIYETLIWRCRPPGSDTLTISYSALQRMTNCARQTVVDGVKQLIAAGLLLKQRQRRLV